MDQPPEEEKPVKNGKMNKKKMKVPTNIQIVLFLFRPISKFFFEWMTSNDE